jgi:hypothetical protein
MSRRPHSPIVTLAGAPRRRRGGTTAGLLVTIGLIGTLAVAATVVTPVYLSAAPDEGSRPLVARHDDNQRVVELLGSLIASSRQVLAVHQRGATPYLQVVLWLEDTANFGAVDADEIAVISHSRLLQTIMLYGRDGEAAEDEAAPVAEMTSDNFSPAFCAAWRARPDVAGRLLARGIESLEIEPAAAAAVDGPRLRISLTWAADSVDGPDKASALLDVAMRCSEETGKE